MAPESAPGSKERDIYLAALAINNMEERRRFVEQACGSNEQLRREIFEMLEIEGELGDFLETSALAGAALHGQKIPVPLRGDIPEVVGPYRIVKKLGEGGSGVVYLAEQVRPVRRSVALKVLKSGMDSKSVLARFEVEREALALMDHPNIARALDAGTTPEGRPYFVMELVQGPRLTEYCDDHSLPLAKRLRLFVQVCHAIQHAHQKGIIHRDIKPSNILVSVHDGIPVPKVIDFGIAKALEQNFSQRPFLTEMLAFLGTPSYTSPEQAAMRTKDVDTRSDIYSLGVLLYELLVGQTPFESERFQRAEIDEVRQIIETEEPEPPSDLLRSFPEQKQWELARSRSVRPSELRKGIEDDLDWIVGKCLEKEPSRRYQTANALANDIQRYLRNEPVSARAPSALYRLQKFVSRNKVLVASGVLLFVTLLVATSVSAWQAMRARRAEQFEALERQNAEAAWSFEAQQRERAEREAYNSQMNMVQQAILANNLGRATELLKRYRPQPGRPDLRQWEWRYFWNQSQSEAIAALPAQPHRIRSVTFSPDERLLLAAQDRGRLTVFDLQRGSELVHLREDGVAAAFTVSPVSGTVAFSVAGRGGSRAVHLWSGFGTEIKKAFTHPRGINALSFGPDDRNLFFIDSDYNLCRWDRKEETLEVISREFEPSAAAPFGFLNGLSAPTFSPDGSRVVLVITDNLHLLETATGREIARIKNPFPEGLASLAISPRGDLLALGPSFIGSQTSISLFSTLDGKLVGELHGHTSWVPGLYFSPDGRRLASAGADQTLRIWEVDTRKELMALRGHLSEVNCVAFGRSGRTIATGCKDGTLFLWDAEKPPEKKPFELIPAQAQRVQFTPRGKLLELSKRKELKLWEPNFASTQSLYSNVQDFLLAPTGEIVVLLGTGELDILDEAGQRIRSVELAGEKGKVPAGLRLVGINGPRSTLITAANGGLIHEWDLHTGNLVRTTETGLQVPSFFLHFAYSPAAGKALIGAGDQPLALLELKEGKVLRIPNSRMLTGLAISPDGTRAASSSMDGTLTFLDGTRFESARVLRAHLLGTHSVTFSPRGQRVVSTSARNEAAKLWDVHSQQEVATLGSSSEIVSQATFSPDGRALVAVDLRGQLSVWKAPTFEEIQAVEQTGARSISIFPDSAP